MKRHPFNIYSLITGVALVLSAAWAVWITVPLRGSFIVDFSRWLVPAAAILIGAALLSPLFTRRKNKKSSEDEIRDAASGVAADPPPDHP